MLHYAVVFLVIALIAAVLGFGGIAAGAAGIAKILFVVFLILAWPRSSSVRAEGRARGPLEANRRTAPSHHFTFYTQEIP